MVAAAEVGPEQVATFHGAGENGTGELARGNRWDWMIEKDPNVATLPRSGTLQCRRNLHLPACIHECA